MKTLIQFQNRLIPVYTINATSKKALKVLTTTLDKKITTGKNTIKRCLASLISIEIIGCEAILHCLNEDDTLALSLY